MSTHGAKQDLWYQMVGCTDRVKETELRQALLRYGLNVSPLGDRVPAGPGLVFFGEGTEQGCDCLKVYSRGGYERVFAIAMSMATLPPTDLWRWLEAGASDVFGWHDVENPASIIAARFERWRRIDQLVESPRVKESLVGESPTWIALLRQLVEVAHFTQASVLLTGESGTGKELAARLIHFLDPRPHKQHLVVLDCTTVVRELSGSEFFGHEKGAFTGAISSREGAFARADKGTLFLDEVGEMVVTMQAELLRVVQEHVYKRVGSNTWRTTDFRLICATNHDLKHEQGQGTFRRDLYYRIASWVISLPPLRERKEDILLLARHFLHQIYPDRDPPGFDRAVRDYLLTRDYPGNVRELRQLVRRMAWRHVGEGPISLGDVAEEERSGIAWTSNDWRDDGFDRAIRRALSVGVGLKEISKAAADTAVRIALDEGEGNLKQAAQRLGVTDRALQMRRANNQK